MSQPPSWGEPPQIPPHRPPSPPFPRTGLGLGAGAGLGALVGILGPILIALAAWGVNSLVHGQAGADLTGMAIIAILIIPVGLLIGGCVLMVPDSTRGWGVGALVASGVWLLSSAGVCTVFFFGALATYNG